MPRTEAENRAIKKYESEKIDFIKIRVPKGQKNKIKSHAEKRGESVNAFINRAITETIQNDNL